MLMLIDFITPVIEKRTTTTATTDVRCTTIITGTGWLIFCAFLSIMVSFVGFPR